MTDPASAAANGFVPPLPFDARPLTDPVDRAALDAYARSARAAGSGVAAGQIVTWVFFGILGVFFVVIFGSMIGLLLSVRGGGWLVPAVVVIGIAGVVTAIVMWTRRRRLREFRLASFAAANGMSYVPSVSDPGLPGMIFDEGHSRRAEDLVRGEQPRFVEFANYQYTTGSGKNSTTHRWGYVAIRLDVPLPNIVLDAQANNFWGTNLPERFAKTQRLSLEGDFDRHFALYCPQGYERDALYLFTPDIMQRFIDHAAAFDVEIVDDWLFLYAKDRQITTLDPAVWARLFETVGAVLDKLAQWARWRDERLRAQASPSPGPANSDVGISDARDSAAHASAAPSAFAGFAAPTPGPDGSGSPWAPAPGVAAPGRRLRRGFSWGTAAMIAVVVAYGLFRIFTR